MNSWIRKGYAVVLVLVVLGLMLCVAVCHYGHSILGSTAISQFEASTSAVAAVAGFLAFVALVFYTNETRLLRIVAGNQLEASIMPMVLFEITAELDTDLRLRHRPLRFKNVGMGPAFNVAVNSIDGSENVRIIITEVPVIESKTERTADWYIEEAGQRGGTALDEAKLDHFICAGRFLDNTEVVVDCKGLSGRKYQFFHTIRVEQGVKVWIEFVRTEIKES